MLFTGCGSAWLECLVWDQEAAGSNPVTPIVEMLYKSVNEPLLLAHSLFILYIPIRLFVEYIAGRCGKRHLCGDCTPFFSVLSYGAPIPELVVAEKQMDCLRQEKQM